MKRTYTLLPGILLCCISCKHVEPVAEVSQQQEHVDSLQAESGDKTAQSPVQKPVDSSLYFPWNPGVYVVPFPGMYTVTVTEPSPCVAPPDEQYPLVVCFSGYPWYASLDHSPWLFSGCLGVPAPDPYKSWYEINLFDTTAENSSRTGLAATRSKEISTTPPSETPEPAKPVPLPEQPWYEAILPDPTRIRKF